MYSFLSTQNFVDLVTVMLKLCVIAYIVDFMNFTNKILDLTNPLNSVIIYIMILYIGVV